MSGIENQRIATAEQQLRLVIEAGLPVPKLKKLRVSVYHSESGLHSFSLPDEFLPGEIERLGKDSLVARILGSRGYVGRVDRTGLPWEVPVHCEGGRAYKSFANLSGDIRIWGITADMEWFLLTLTMKLVPQEPEKPHYFHEVPQAITAEILPRAIDLCSRVCDPVGSDDKAFITIETLVERIESWIKSSLDKVRSQVDVCVGARAAIKSMQKARKGSFALVYHVNSPSETANLARQLLGEACSLQCCNVADIIADIGDLSYKIFSDIGRFRPDTVFVSGPQESLDALQKNLQKYQSLTDPVPLWLLPSD